MQELKLDNVYDVWYTSFWQTYVGYATIIAIIIASFVALYFIISVIQAYRRGSTKDQALRMLKALKMKIESNRLDARKAYQELTDTIKGYVQWRYHMPRGMTDYELVVSLKDVGCEQTHCDDVSRIIADAQAIKFGHAEILKKQIQEDVNSIVSFIEATGKHKE